MLGAFLLKPVFMSLKSELDHSEYGGAIFLGLDGISVKAHVEIQIQMLLKML